jgi:hypothetical protein
MQKSITDKDRQRAEFCAKKCTGCRKARAQQRGFFFWFLKSVESKICPACRAYAKVYGRKAYEPAG